MKWPLISHLVVLLSFIYLASVSAQNWTYPFYDSQNTLNSGATLAGFTNPQLTWTVTPPFGVGNISTPVGYVIRCPIFNSDESIVFATTSGPDVLSAISADNGTILWSIPFTGMPRLVRGATPGIISAPISARLPGSNIPVVIITFDDTVFCFYETGQLAWQTQAGLLIGPSVEYRCNHPTVTQDGLTLIVPGGAGIQGVDLIDGTVRWSVNTTFVDNRGFRGPAARLNGDTFVLLSMQRVHVFNTTLLAFVHEMPLSLGRSDYRYSQITADAVRNRWYVVEAFVQSTAPELYAGNVLGGNFDGQLVFNLTLDHTYPSMALHAKAGKLQAFGQLLDLDTADGMPTIAQALPLLGGGTWVDDTMLLFAGVTPDALAQNVSDIEWNIVGEINPTANSLLWSYNVNACRVHFAPLVSQRTGKVVITSYFCGMFALQLQAPIGETPTEGTPPPTDAGTGQGDRGFVGYLQDNWKIGVGIGVAAIVLIAAAIVIIVCICRRRARRTPTITARTLSRMDLLRTRRPETPALPTAHV